MLLVIGCTNQKEPSYEYLTEKIFFSSKNILGFENIFDEGLDLQEDIEVFGIMHFPDNYDSSKKYPVVVASHGSYNWRSHHLMYLEQMRKANFIVFAMHPFDSRNVKSTPAFEYKLIGYRSGNRDSSVILKKGNKEFVVAKGEKLEGVYELVQVTKDEVIFRNQEKIYKIAAQGFSA